MSTKSTAPTEKAQEVINTAVQNQPEPKRGCLTSFLKISLLVIVIAAVPVWWFCFHTTRLRISPETTFITSPLKSDGTPDYFAAWSERTWLPKLSPPEDNGQRLMIAAFGPNALEQAYLAKNVPWEEMPTNKDSKRWFAENWIPLCEAMGIDPFAKPPYLNISHIVQHVGDKAKSLEGKPEEKAWEYEAFRERFAKTSWKTAEQPEVAGWLAEIKPALDLFGVAVRKPNFEGWRRRPNSDWGYGESMMDILLPDAQANREFVRELEVRVAAKTGDGDIDGALYDVMSMYRFAGHFRCSDLIVCKFIGCAAEGMATQSLMVILKSGKATKEQLSRFSAELKTLPSHWDVKSMQSLGEDFLCFEMMMLLSQKNAWDKKYWEALKQCGLDSSRTPSSMSELVSQYVERIHLILPFDRNITGRRMTEELKHVSMLPTAWQSSPSLWLKYVKEADEYQSQNGFHNNSVVSYLFKSLFVRTRSQYVGDHIVGHLAESLKTFIVTMVRNGTQAELLQLAIQLECYKLDTGKYPDSLDELVPKYIDEVPLDPFTGKKTLTYKLAPEKGTEYLLYSFGLNGIDDNGLDAPSKREKNDIVIRR